MLPISSPWTFFFAHAVIAVFSARSAYCFWVSGFAASVAGASTAASRAVASPQVLSLSQICPEIGAITLCEEFTFPYPHAAEGAPKLRVRG